MISGTTARSSSWPRGSACPVDVQDVEQAPAGVPNGGDDALQAAAAVVLDDDAGVGGDVGAQVGIDPSGIGDRRRYAVVDETSSQRAALDQELDLEGTRQHPVQRPDDQLVLADGQRAHNRRLYEADRRAPRARLRRHARVGRSLAARAVAAGLAIAARPAAQQFRRGVDLVRLPVVVTGRTAQPVRGLKPQDFEVLEDGQAAERRVLRRGRARRGTCRCTSGCARPEREHGDATCATASNAAIQFVEALDGGRGRDASSTSTRPSASAGSRRRATRCCSSASAIRKTGRHDRALRRARRLPRARAQTATGSTCSALHRRRRQLEPDDVRASCRSCCGSGT